MSPTPSSPAPAAAAPVSHGAVVEALGRRIVGGAQPPGSTMTLASIEDDFAVSRTVAREAVRVLETHGILASRRRVGIVVQPAQTWNRLDATVIEWMLDGPRRREALLELTQLRCAVEPMAARLAAQRASNAERAELVRWAEELRDRGARGEGDTPEYLAADIAYHSLLLRSSGNALFATLTEPITEILRGRALRGLTPGIPRDGTLEAHVRTARSIARGDAEGAERSAREHLMLASGEFDDA